MNGKETVMPRDTLNLTPANNSEFEPCYGVRYHKLKEVREDGVPSHPHTLACNLELRMASFAHSKRQARGPPAAVTELFPSRSHDSPNPCYSKGTHTHTEIRERWPKHSWLSEFFRMALGMGGDRLCLPPTNRVPAQSARLEFHVIATSTKQLSGISCPCVSTRDFDPT